MKKYLVLIIAVILTSCADKKENNHTYFGGKIINPKSDYVLLYKTNELLDSIKLTQKNTFMCKLKNIKPGLYFFKHGVEHQYVYLEPKDSLLIRLNTWGFDESLVFSGTSAEKNNALIETFLQNEKDKKEFARYYSLNSEDFLAKVDSTKKEKKKNIDNFKTNNPLASSDFIDILEVALTYPVYTKYENYIYENYIRDNNKHISSNDLNNKFLTHRTNTNINRDSLMFYIPYRNYVYSHLYSDVSQKNINKNTDEFTIALLENINAKIHSDKQRNRLLRHITIRDFYNNSSGQIKKKIFDTYFSLSTSRKDKEEVNNLISDIKRIKAKEKLPSFSLIQANQKSVDINKLIENKKTLIYFEGKKSSSDEWLVSRVKYLMNKNNDTQFLLVNSTKRRNNFIKNINVKYQYSLDDKSDAHEFLNCQYPRVLLINKKGIIKNSFAALSSDKIEQQITDL